MRLETEVSLDPSTQKLIEELHDSSSAAVLAVTGGGVQALSWLLGTPGASRTVVEVRVPYAGAALEEFLGYMPDQNTSAETARAMARSSFRRAVSLAPRDARPLGVGCTAALATDRPKRGEHRCHVSVRTEEELMTYSLTLTKGLRDRQGEDEVVSKLVLRALADGAGIDFDLSMGLGTQEQVEVESLALGDAIDQLVAGEVGMVTVAADGAALIGPPSHRAVLPGSFDPLHDGHEELARVVSQRYRGEVAFEMSVTNVDKPSLEAAVVRERLSQFAGKDTVVLTRAPRFDQKAELLPRSTFVIGIDTAVRVVEPKYYGDDEAEMVGALVDLRRAGCGFLVAGRAMDGAFRKLEDVAVPSAFDDMFEEIPESTFRRDISSSELRAAGRTAAHR